MHAIHTLPNGVRVMYQHADIPVAYVGVAIDAGTRDELENESGMAHFVEHMMFKGTTHRRAYNIINRLEAVGGRMDAYTTKEDTYVYSVVPAEHVDRAVDLMADVVLCSTFPDREIDKERVVVLDEIDSYLDTPSDLIYDQFEELIFPGDPIGRSILGSEASLDTFDSRAMQAFVRRNYTADRLLLFVMGPTPEERLLRLAEHSFGSAPVAERPFNRYTFHPPVEPFRQTVKMDTNQCHCLIGCRTERQCCPDRYRMVLLNNIVGGPNMSSALNMALRERHGYCYTVESLLSGFTDTGLFQLYFGCDPHNFRPAYQLCQDVLHDFCVTPLTDHALSRAKQQLRGQVLIADRDEESWLLSITKQILHREPVRSNDELLAEIDQISAEQLRQTAGRLFNRLSTLIYQ